MKKTSNKNQAFPLTDASGTATAEAKTCDRCDDPLLFAMRDNYHEFSMGLLTILQCLSLAEKEGYVPSLPEAWWVQLAVRYNLRL